MHMYLLYKQRVERRGGLTCEGTESTSICGMVLEDFVIVLGGFFVAWEVWVVCGSGGVVPARHKYEHVGWMAAWRFSREGMV